MYDLVSSVYLIWSYILTFNCRHRLDRLKLIKFPPSAIHAVKTAIERSWIKGIQNEREAAGLVEIQFKGNPWSGQGDDTCSAIYTMSEIMAALYHLGWSLIMATDISKRVVSGYRPDTRLLSSYHRWIRIL